MKTLKIDEKWSLEYDETQNDRPVKLLRYGDPVLTGIVNWTNEVYAMFYALLAYEESAADKRRLVRELDIAMHGEEGAAQQASLCDLIHPAKDLRKRAKAAEAEVKRLSENNSRYPEAMAAVEGGAVGDVGKGEIMTSSEPKFEPCICGGSADWYLEEGSYHSMCDTCFLIAPPGATIEDAVDSWGVMIKRMSSPRDQFFGTPVGKEVW